MDKIHLISFQGGSHTNGQLSFRERFEQSARLDLESHIIHVQLCLLNSSGEGRSYRFDKQH